MVRKIWFFVLVVIYYKISGTSAQTCVPNPVYEIQLPMDYVLSWLASDNCPGTEYTVRISTGGVLQYAFTVDDVKLDVSFLTFCLNYEFTITPASNHIVGMETSLTASLALPAGINIEIMNLTAAQIDDDLLIQWRVNDQHAHCVTYYHMLRWDEDAEAPESLYLGQAGYFLEHVAQCMKYRFQVTAYYFNANGSAGILEYMVPEATNTPSLVEVRQDSATINTTWSLERYYINRCTITALNINGRYFNNSYPINDIPERPNVQISIPDLRPNSMYFFNVTTENTAGTSSPVLIAVQTLPLDPNL